MQNPYESPISPLADSDRPSSVRHLTSGSNTILPRHLAAGADTVGAFVLSVAVFKWLPDDVPLVQGLAVLAVWAGYYFLSEGLLGATPGKLLTGMVIITLEGDRIGWRQAGIRTLLRTIEVNPFILGGIPAAICILFSPRRQRLGDMLARTIVVRRKKFR